MDRKPEKRRLTWFGNNRPAAPKVPSTSIPPNSPGTLSRMWDHEPPRREEANAWPKLPEGDLFAARGGSDDQRGDRYDGQRDDSYTDEHAAPAWGQPDARQGDSRGGRLRELWRTFATNVPRPRLALLAVVATLALCAVMGVAALGVSFFNNAANSARHPLTAGGVSGASSSATTKATATATATGTTSATPATTAAPTALTITFTCAQGAAGGAGQVCVRTAPHAALNLTVRYCDGSNAKGKTFHTTSYADSGGNYTWRWNVASGACVGAATATVTAQLAGKTINQKDTFAITR